MHSKDPTHFTNNVNGRMTENKSLISNVPFHPGPAYRPLPKPIRPVMSNQQSSQRSQGIGDINPNIILVFEENFSFQEGVLSETFQRLDKSFFQDPTE